MFNVRLKFLAASIFLMMALILARLGYMQILRGDYYREEGAKRRISVSNPSAPRGTIFARDGTILAQDQPVKSVCVILKDLNTLDDKAISQWYAAKPDQRGGPYPWDGGEEMTAWCGTVGEIVGENAEEIEARIETVLLDIEKEAAQERRRQLSGIEDPSARQIRNADREARKVRRSGYRRKRAFFEDCDFRTAARAEVISADLPGLAVTQSMKRKYPQGKVAAHVVGYIAAITPEEWDLYKYDYHTDERKRVFWEDKMGRSGIEKQYNFDLRCSRGRLKEVINVIGQPQLTLEHEPPIPGADTTLSIDPYLQAAAEKALAAIAEHPDPDSRRGGAAVCMDIQSGEILVLASSPAFDPNSISEDLADLIDPEGLGRLRPLRNRATGSAYPLGSVFKIITTTAGLESGAISPTSVLTCNGIFKLGRGSWKCWINRTPARAHGPIDLQTAIKVSCNAYFYQVGVKAGGQALSDWARHYGFGDVSEIDLSGEVPGLVSTPPHVGEAVNLSIGQGALLVTPLQVCRMAAAVANGGRLLAPTLNRNLDSPLGRSTSVGFSETTWNVLRQGLYDVVNVRGGTGYGKVTSELLTVAGKTSTAQAPPDGDIAGDHAWFAGFAPFENPEIAFAVLIEHGGHGGVAAGPVAKAIAEAYAERGIAR